MKYCMIEVAFASEQEVHQAVNELLKLKLVCGAQIIKADSKWRWEDKIELCPEYLVFLKTKKSLVKEVYDTIRKIHSYECFEFAEFPMDSCYQEYLDWIEEETK